MTRGGYNTRAKAAVQSALMNRGEGTATADELLNDLRAAGEKIGKTTVYRQLEQMVMCGSARRTQGEAGASLYQYVGDKGLCEHHLHFRCQMCGRIYHVECECCEMLCDHLASRHGFVLDARETMLVGLCGECARPDGEREGANGAVDTEGR